jgi:hypothetical protein
VRCDAPEKLARHLFDAGVLLGFDLETQDGTLNIRVREPAMFYDQWAGLLLNSGVAVYEVRSQSRSLKQIFEKVTG